MNKVALLPEDYFAIRLKAKEYVSPLKENICPWLRHMYMLFTLSPEGLSKLQKAISKMLGNAVEAGK